MFWPCTASVAVFLRWIVFLLPSFLEGETIIWLKAQSYVHLFIYWLREHALCAVQSVVRDRGSVPQLGCSSNAACAATLSGLCIALPVTGLRLRSITGGWRPLVEASSAPTPLCTWRRGDF